MKRWQNASRALRAAAAGSYVEGSIPPQVVMGGDDNLNQARLDEFMGMKER